MISGAVMTNIAERCKRISSSFTEKNFCEFAESGSIAVLDTSQRQDGSRGIAFYEDRLAINLDGGSTRSILYSCIKSMQIISSFEDSFADDLSILSEDCEIIISDYSLDKAELKLLITELVEAGRLSECKKLQTEEYAEMIAQRLAENALQNQTDDILIEEGDPVISEIEIPRERLLPDGYSPAPIPEDGINWISSGISKPQDNATTEPPVESESESETRTKIQNMSREETLSYLAQSLSEINGSGGSEEADDNEPITDLTSVQEEVKDSPPVQEEVKEDSPPAQEEITDNPPAQTEAQESPSVQDVAKAAEAAPIESEIPQIQNPEANSDGLTIEPIWGDIYIKASRNLREVIESGKLTMEQIESELKDKLLDSARAFAEITADEAKIPKSLVARIQELKAAAGRFDQYFKEGEDIAVRAMFFMMYQMLSYADRIVEAPETKERLNDFFRRFGPAGITLSMLDMRV